MSVAHVHVGPYNIIHEVAHAWAMNGHVTISDVGCEY